MNEKRFIELLNLHIDGEILPSEQEELDREVAHDFRRRATYQSYCRLEEASRQVYRRLGPALTQAVDLKKYQMIARSSTRCCLRRGLLYSTGALAAACLTVAAAVAVFQDVRLAFVSTGVQEKENSEFVEVLDPNALNSRQRERQAFAFHSSGSSDPFTFSGRPVVRAKRKTAFLEASRTDFQSSAGWIEGHQAARVFRGNASFEATSELTSFHFQR